MRLAAMLGWLAVCLVLYHLWKLARLRNPWPPRFLGGIARIAGAEITVVGPQPPPGAFILANHVSWIDIPAIAQATGSAFVAHSGLATNPFLRWLCEMNGTVFVARDQRGGVAQQVEQVRQALRDTGALTIFPEGTTSDGVDLLPFKSSLLAALDPLPAGIIVQPVLLDYGAQAATIAWVGDEPGAANFLRILARARPVKLTMQLLPPLSGDALANRKTIAAGARDAIETALHAARQAG